jgi:membrane-bound lytic murein transglycosylase D
VGRAIAANQKRGLPTDFLSLKLPTETMNYVPRLIAVKNIILAPALYDIELESIPDRPYFTAVASPAKIDVKLAAQLAGMSVEEFVALNPAHNKPVAVSLAPSGTLLLPLDKADDFRENLENWDKPLVTWNTVQGKKGESVDAIAKRYGLTGAALRQVNNLQVNRNGRLAVAQPVLVPGRNAGTQVASAKAAPDAGKAPAAKEAPSPSAEARPSSPAAKTPFYTVKAGDTLYGIARQFGKGVPDLLRLNNLTARVTLQPGLRLRVH